MYKFIISVKKEFLLLFSDKAGLALMFIMPLILVFIITIIQDSAFSLVKENKISIVVVNNDEGPLGEEFANLLETSGMFSIKMLNETDTSKIKNEISADKALAGILIPEDFSEKIGMKSSYLSRLIMADLGLQNEIIEDDIDLPVLMFYNDPILEDNYIFSIMNMIYSHLHIIENTAMLRGIYHETGFENIPDEIMENMLKNRIEIIREQEKTGSHIPNSTQHNVPAWTIFAMFFMVISLSSNILKERLSGSFLRLKTIPTNFNLIIFSKQLIYMIVGLLQVILIFSMGIFVFPLINLPELSLPENITGLLLIIFISCFAAVSYALMIGAVFNTPEQANGFGAISVIIFAAIGGVWVPTFIMPEYMKFISKISPLHWCIEAFYVLFLKAGEWIKLIKPFFILVIFSLFCQIVTFLKFKKEKII